MSLISDRTKFTFAVVISLLALGSWLTTMYWQGAANASEISKSQVRLERLESLATDVAVIKQEVHEINKKLDQ